MTSRSTDTHEAVPVCESSRGLSDWLSLSDSRNSANSGSPNLDRV